MDALRCAVPKLTSNHCSLICIDCLLFGRPHACTVCRYTLFFAPRALFAGGLLVGSTAAYTQDGLIARWQARVTATLAQQPDRAPPVVSPYPQLIQVVRADFYRTVSSTHVITWNYGFGRGINLIPLKNTEIDIFYPDYVQHSKGAVDGFGDLGFLGEVSVFLAQ